MKKQIPICRQAAPAFRTAIAACGLMAACLAFATAARAVVIDFEDQEPAFLQNQYSTLGVTFNSPRLRDYTQSPGFVRSGTKAIELCFGQEFCSAPLDIRFTDGQSRARLWIGYSSQLAPASTVVLQALDQNGAVMGQASVVLAASTGPIPVQTLLEVTSASPNIRRLVLTFATGPDGPAFNNGLVIDDLEFDVAGGPPPCAATSAPGVLIDQPVLNQIVNINRFLLQGTVTTDAPLDEALLIVDGFPIMPGNSRTSDLLGGTIISQTGGPFGAINMNDALFPGINLVRVRARNCFGTGETPRLVEYAPIFAGTRFRMLGLEVVQATQDIGNSVPLVANKSTIVRVYLSVQGPTTSIVGITGSITATPPAAPSLPPLLHSVNSVTVGSSPDLTSKRLDFTASLNFVMPTAWTDGRTLHIELSKLYIQGQESNLPCDGCANLDEINAPRWTHFQPTRPLNLVLAPYIYRNGLTPDILFTPMVALQWVNNAYPLRGNFPGDGSGIQLLRILPMRSTDKDLSFSSDEGSDFLDDLEDIRNDLQDQYEDEWPSEFYVVAPIPAGSGRASHSRGVAYVDTWNEESGMVVPQSSMNRYGSNWAHEIGHILDRDHASNAHGESTGGDVDSGFLLPHGGIGQPGLAINTEWWRNTTPFVVNPGTPSSGQEHAHDFMSYGHGSTEHTMMWVSPYTYRALFNHFQIVAQAQAPAVQSLSEKLIVSGRIKADGTAIFRPFRRINTRVKAAPGTTGEFQMELLDASGTVLHSQRIDARRVEGTDDLSFHEFMPWSSGTQRIVLRGKAGILAERIVSTNAPWVRVKTPAGGKSWSARTELTWEAGDADGDPLTFTVLYSTGADDPWIPIANGLKEAKATIDTSVLPGSKTARLRVRVTDGVNTTVADSAATFAVPDKAPKVGIFYPMPETGIEANKPTEFVGISYDAEDGMLADARLKWSSDRDGPLGQGRRLALKGLSPGAHTITLAATDRKGQSASTTVSIVVGRR